MYRSENHLSRNPASDNTGVRVALFVSTHHQCARMCHWRMAWFAWPGNHVFKFLYLLPQKFVFDFIQKTSLLNLTKTHSIYESGA